MTLKQLNKKARSLSTNTRVNYIIEHENGSLSVENTFILFANLIRTGLAWQLQGSIYGRPAKQLIDLGYISTGGEILKIS